ncbi:hypothetical protein ACS0TY_026891 [Phlomoides rotata]
MLGISELLCPITTCMLSSLAKTLDEAVVICVGECSTDKAEIYNLILVPLHKGFVTSSIYTIFASDSFPHGHGLGHEWKPGTNHLLSPELHTYFAKLAQTYGPIYTLKLGKKIRIVISSPALAKQVLKDQDTTFANRDIPMAGKEAAYGGADIVWTPYGPEWRMLRKVCVREMLSCNTLDSVYGLRRKELR